MNRDMTWNYFFFNGEVKLKKGNLQNKNCYYDESILEVYVFIHLFTKSTNTDYLLCTRYCT